MPDTPIIDPAAIANLRSLNPDDGDEFLREIRDIFVEDTPKRIDELESSLRTEDLGKFTRAAHSIKGSSANLGALMLRAAAERLEHHSRHQGFADAAPMIAEIKVEFERARTELDRIAQPAS